MTWRYQPVWVGDENGYKRFSVARVEVRDDGALLNWQQDEAPRLWCDSMQAVRDRLARMLMDANLYKPVAFSTLKAGMVFERVGE